MDTRLSRACCGFGFVVLVAMALGVAPASAQFRDDFDGPSIHPDWTFFTGDGSATVEFRQGDGCGTLMVDATKDRANIWWALIKRNIASSIDVKRLSEPGQELRLEARVRIFEAPRRVHLQANTQRTVDYEALLQEFDIADTEWHTISWTTRGLHARPEDGVNVQFGISDWGLGRYRAEIDYLKADVVDGAHAGPDVGALPFHPPKPDPARLTEKVLVSNDGTIDLRFPDINLNGWHATEGDRKVPVLTVNGDQLVIMRWNLKRYAGARVAGPGLLELTTQSMQTVTTEPEEFGQIRVTEILGGDPAWDQRTVTFNSLLKGQPLDAVLNPQMVLDERVAARRGEKTYVTISQPVLQRLLDGRTLGLAIRPLGPIDATFYGAKHENGRLGARLLFNTEDSVPPIVRARNLLVSCTAEPGTTRVFHVALANRSSTPFVSRILVSVHLGHEGFGFWAPFDLVGKPVGPNSPTPVSIGPNQAKRVLIHLHDLRWARTISSRWPSEPLVAAVPAGRYSATIRVEGEGGAADRWYTVGSCPAVVVPIAPRGNAPGEA